MDISTNDQVATLTEHRFVEGEGLGLSWSSRASATLECILAAQTAQVSAAASGYNKHQNYKYPKYEDTFAAIHPYLVQYRCVILFHTEEVRSDVVTMLDANGKLVYYSVTTCTGTMSLVNSRDAGDWVRSRAFGFAMDKSSDKALKAHTICRKYALKGLFGMTDNQDPDDDKSDVRRFNTPAPGPGAVTAQGQAYGSAPSGQWSM